MKQLIKEAKRMQQLAGVIKESQQLNEGDDIFNDIEQDLLHSDLDQEEQIEYLKDIINYCQSKINEIESNLNENQLNEAETFNTWLSDISSGRDFIKQDINKLGVDINTVTPEEFIEAVKSAGRLVNQDLEAYKFGTATTVYPVMITFDKGLETFGTYNLRTGKHSITSKSYDPRTSIYPQGSKMD